MTPRDSNYIGQEHRFCVLRPELIASFVEVSLSHFLTVFTKLQHGLFCRTFESHITVFYHLYLQVESIKQSLKQKVPDAPVASTSDAKVRVDSNPCVLAVCSEALCINKQLTIDFLCYFNNAELLNL